MRLAGWILVFIGGVMTGLAAPPEIYLPEIFHYVALTFVIPGVFFIAKAK